MRRWMRFRPGILRRRSGSTGRLLRRGLEGVTKLRVRSGGTCHRDESTEKTLFEIEDAAEIEQVISNIQMEKGEEGGHCMCCGEPSFEFYKGEKLIGTLGFHHGRTLRWPSGWPSDGAINEESAEFFCVFLDKHGDKESLPLIEGMANAAKEGADREAFEKAANVLR